MIVYITNGRVTRNQVDDRSYHGYFMGYAASTVVILYWNPYQPFIICRAHNVWFDKYNSYVSIENKHTPGS